MSDKSFPIYDTYANSLVISKDLIEELRQKIVERVDKTPDLYYSEDIKRLRSNDWFVRRFLYEPKSKTDVNKALDALDKSLKWRKSFGVRDINNTDFAREAYLSAGAFIYGTDLNGSPILIMRAKVVRKIKSWVKNAYQFLVLLFETIDTNYEGKGLTILMDCRDAGIMNADMDALKFLHTVLNDYYPGLVSSALVFKLPTVLEAIFKICRSWLNDEQSKYMYTIGKKTINQYVSVDQLPDILLGTNPLPYRNPPDNAPGAHELAERLSIKPEKADKLVKHLEKFYEK
ncbi:motile sperm domain-containing protein 2-like [Oppia nitens]|uniref:motile sperm domain-containing protein 2-like n=1 Tax=Oppia nitens TaxID=1686743 RepID=UPI0023D9A0D3|nr:motile sperm domain-containing protein 2-like [Oppia nitens]